MSNNSLILNLNGKLVDLSNPVVMGIVNVTPDSFFKANRFTSDKSILTCVEKILVDGGKFIDIGGYSTRPGADHITQEEEIKRISSGLEIILKKFPDALISVDTFRSGVVRHVVSEFSIPIINDISGGTLDDLMFETIADLRLAYILMHSKGNPQNMQSLANYTDVVSEVMYFLEKRIARLRLLGVKDIIVDPGFGFAKTEDNNYKLLKCLSYFKELNVPILAGLSRKSMLYKMLNIDAENALNATTAVNMLALFGGASILRVHDVKEAVEAVRLYNRYINV